MTTRKKTTRPRGRPKGAKTKTYPVVREQPPRCPTCGSSRRTAKKWAGKVDGFDAVERPRYDPFAENGKWYQMILSVVDCLDCKQRYRIMTKYYLGKSRSDNTPPDSLPDDFDPNSPEPEPDPD